MSVCMSVCLCSCTNSPIHQYINTRSEGGADKIFLVHRLDKDTSGVIVVSTNEQVSQDLKAAFAKREVKKTYKALAFGKLGQNFPGPFPIAWKDQLIVNKLTSKVRDIKFIYVRGYAVRIWLYLYWAALL